MDTQTRNRPSLEVNTGYDEYDLPDGLPRFPPSSVKPLPTPLSSASLGRLPSLAPIAEQQAMALDTPASMAEQTRNILLSGMTVSQATDLGTVANRRLSAPADMLQKQRRQSLLLTQPDTLQDWGHVYLGSATKADVFVAPSALRRPSSGGGTGHGTPQGRPENHRVAIRARVRPRRKDRRPFVIARDFDLDQLRATIPAPTPPPSAHDVPASARTPLSLLATSPLAGRGARRASMAASGLGMQPFREGRAQQAGSKEFPIRKQSTLCRSCRTVLIIIVWSI